MGSGVVEPRFGGGGLPLYVDLFSRVLTLMCLFSGRFSDSTFALCFQ